MIKVTKKKNKAIEAGKILIGGMLVMPFIPLNKKSKYTAPNYK